LKIFYHFGAGLSRGGALPNIAAARNGRLIEILRPEPGRKKPMTDPVVAQKSPYGVEVEAGEEYWWCSCGQSEKQPFCDGSHKGTDFKPEKFAAEESKTVWFCGCKSTGKSPVCDGTHSKL